jgi:hypothetical protein
MRLHKGLVGIAVFATALAFCPAPLVAQGDNSAAAGHTTTSSPGNDAKQDMKKAGSDTKNAAKSTGNGVKNGAKATGKAVKKGTNKAATKTEQGADKVKDKTTDSDSK